MILVTGGAGYIGSHTVVTLIEEGYDVVIADNLSNSNINIINNLKTITSKNIPFYKIDVSIEESVINIFKKHNIKAVLHFAGHKAVEESVQKPLMYYYNNLLTTITLLKVCNMYNVNNFIFSSSATIYGNNISPLTENMDLKPTTNPYGETKVICERILKDACNSNKNLCVTSLRYFNPLGAHKSGLIGELPNGVPNNLMPFITQVAKGKREKLYVFGNDYDTIDGTGVRDYIHVLDLAKGHVLALKNIKKGMNTYNLGTGKGYSVLEIIKTFEKTNNVTIPYSIAGRRKGDLGAAFANCTKAKEQLGFTTTYTLEDMCSSSWNFEKNLKN